MKRLLALLCLLCAAWCAQAHENMPASLLLQARADGLVDVRWRLPQTQGPAPRVMPEFSAHCVPLAAAQAADLPGAKLLRWQMRCQEGLGAGTRIDFPGLEVTMVDVLVRIEDASGQVQSHIARPQAPSVTLGQPEAHSLAVSSYFGLGVEHILGGIDHLLFVLCLILLIPSVGGLVKTITAFTFAHSITLALAALGLVHVSGPPVEAVIALSILFLARELAVQGSGQRLAVRMPWAVAFVFGLLHGFGFAGALSEVGLPQGDIPAALLLFNLGVEAGQLAFVAVAAPLVMLARQQAARLPRWAPAVPIYAVGAVAGFWWLQRMVPVLGLQSV